MSLYYFVTGDGGTDATVGIQGQDVNGGKWSPSVCCLKEALI
jgi:hypothetical protein